MIPLERALLLFVTELNLTIRCIVFVTILFEERFISTGY